MNRHWESKSITRRYKINEGIARGIFYLHQNSQLTIIHRDLKPINVLLDANMNPKFQILVCQPSLEQSKFEEIPTKLLGPCNFLLIISENTISSLKHVTMAY